VAFVVDYFETGEKEAKRIAKRFEQPFDLSKAPLLKVGLLNVDQKRHVILIDMHHIISDGISTNIMKDDFQALYNGEILQELKLQYKDYAEWRNTPNQVERRKKQGAYWLKEFSGEIPILNLLTGYDRPAILDTEGSSISVEMGKKELEGLKRLAAEEGVTLFMLLLALFNILLSKFSGQEDIVVGTPTSGRIHSDLERIIGMFVNTLALRNKPVADYPFNKFLKKVKEQTLTAFDNQEYQYEELVEKVLKKRELNRNPLFDVMLQLQDQTQSTTTPSQIIPEPYNLEAVYDLSLLAIEKAEYLSLRFIYRIHLFKDEIIKKIIDHFMEIVAAVIVDKKVKLKDIKISHELIGIKLELPQEEGDFTF
jgi:hypothetical protein